jgi:glycosyltransferase involved in cell wall biosynthesis
VKNEKPYFTIITVTFNSAKTIVDTLESVLNQSYVNYEYLIIDGKSTDNTISIVKSYERKFKGKLKYLSEKDNGIYDAMNKGLSLAKGSIIGIINSDDWYESDTLETIYKTFSKQDIDLAYGLLRFFKDNILFSIECHTHHFIQNSMIPHPTCFIRKRIYDIHGMFDINYKSAADYDLIIRFLKKGVRFHLIYKILANFRIGGMSYGLTSRYETNLIRYKYGFISKKAYLLQLIRILIKF